jgi:hypothetical protein
MKVFLDASNRVVTIPTDNGNIDLTWIQTNRPELNATQQIDNCPPDLHRFQTQIMSVCETDKDYHEKTSGDGTDISHYTLQQDLRCPKLDAAAIVDAKTEKLLQGPQGLGFQFNTDPGGTDLTYYFSMSVWGQLNLVGGVLADTNLPTPITWSTHTLEGNYSTYDIPDLAALRTIYLTGLGRKKAIMESGSSIKLAIEAAVDQAGIDAALATDTRQFSDYP